MPEVAAAGSARPIATLDRAWRTGPGVLRRARALELSTFTFSIAGRAGVLGDRVDPRVLVAALGRVAPEALQDGWEAARRVGPAAVARAWLEECAAWGEQALADERLAELLGRVVEAADDTGLPLAAATRTAALALLPAAGPGARVALLCHALAEFRQAAMVVAGRFVGLSPVEALVAEPEGDQEALLLGWSPPFPDRLAVLRRHVAASAVADRLTVSAFRALSAGERAELVDRLTAAAASVAGTG